MKYDLVRAMVYGEEWAILPEKLATILDVLERRAIGETATEEELAAFALAARKPQPRGTTAIGVLPVYGTIHHRLSMMGAASGGTSTQQIAEQFRALLDAPQVSAVVLDIDSPGGAVAGTTELANEIRALRGRKPIVAVANGMAASAAYWIASSADEIVVTPSGEVGSIGIVAIHEDRSRMLERMGVAPTMITAGKFKAERSPFGPLSEEARAAAQAAVDAHYDVFVNDVAAGRGVPASKVRAGFGEGRMVLAQEAVRLGMADRVATLDAVLAGLGVRPEGPRGHDRRAEARRDLDRLSLGL